MERKMTKKSVVLREIISLCKMRTMGTKTGKILSDFRAMIGENHLTIL